MGKFFKEYEHRHCRKRGRDLDTTQSAPPAKKPRLVTTQLTHEQINSDAFIEFCNVIGDCKLIKFLNIPSALNQIVAEYACDIHACATDSCGKSFNVLREEIVLYDDKDKFFCKNCSADTVFFDCCNTVQHKKDLVVCHGHAKDGKPCYHAGDDDMYSSNVHLKPMEICHYKHDRVEYNC